MKKLQLSLLFSLAVLVASSQKVYFVYVQADPEQAFFVKMKEKVYSSSASGYIILSKLVDSTYSFSIGFPQNKWPEQQFSVTINKKDHGYLLKNFGEKGWGLFDLQTLAIQMATGGNTGTGEKQTAENKDVSPFTEILSVAADDPSLKERKVLPAPEVKKTEAVVADVPKKEESKAAVVVTDVPKKEEPKSEVKETVVEKPVVPVVTAAVIKQETKPELKEPAVIKTPEVVETAVVKKEEPGTGTKETTVPLTKPTETIEQPVVKKEEPKKEEKAVVTITEPAAKQEAVNTVSIAKQESQPDTTDTKPAQTPVPAESYTASQVKKWSENAIADGLGLVFIDTYPNGSRDTISLVIPNPLPAVSAVNDEPVRGKEEKKFIEGISADTTSQAPKTTTPSYKILSSPPIGSSGINSNCKETAGESDFFKLRKTMAAGKNDEEMLGTAKKYFKSKCFSTTQVKNLSTLFLNDEAKYRFFDLANGRVTDMYNFPALAGELRDEYYINRFRAMIRN